MKKVFVYIIACAIVPIILVSCNKEGGKGETQGKIITNAVKDKDGNKYDAVKIGDQVWMAENLRTTRYEDGTDIPMGGSGSKGTGKRYYPNDDANNVERYGYLYDWDAVMNGDQSSEANPSGVQGICPKGWHVPSDAEWTELVNYVEEQLDRGDLLAGSEAKALASKAGWNSSSASGAPGFESSENNATGFSAVPAGGHRYDGRYNFGASSSFWSATGNDSYNAYGRYLSYNGASVSRYNGSKYNGFSVRCLRD